MVPFYLVTFWPLGTPLPMKISDTGQSANADLPLCLIVVKRVCGLWSPAGFRTRLDQLGD